MDGLCFGLLHSRRENIVCLFDNAFESSMAINLIINFFRRIRENKQIVGGTIAAALLSLRVHYARSDHALFSGLRYGRLPFSARKCDWVIVKEVVFENEYGFIAEVLRGIEKPRIVDGGANIGTFALTAFNMIPDAMVYSFEASQETFAILKMNQNLNPALCWETKKAAMWRANETVDFTNSDCSASSRIGGDQGRHEAVEGINFDAVMFCVGDRADLMKIDIEGAEGEFLSIASSKLANVGQMIIELHPGRCDIQKILNVLRERWTHLYEIAGRTSSKPLILATDTSYNLPPFILV